MPAVLAPARLSLGCGQCVGDSHRRPCSAFAPRVARACVAFAAPGGSRPLCLAARGSRPPSRGALPLGCRFVRAGPVSGRVVDVISAARSKNKRAARRTSEVVTVLVRLWLGGWVCAPQSLSSGNTCVNLTSSQHGVGRVVLGGSTRSASRVGSRILATAIGGGAWPYILLISYCALSCHTVTFWLKAFLPAVLAPRPEWGAGCTSSLFRRRERGGTAGGSQLTPNRGIVVLPNHAELAGAR